MAWATHRSRLSVLVWVKYRCSLGSFRSSPAQTSSMISCSRFSTRMRFSDTLPPERSFSLYSTELKDRLFTYLLTMAVVSISIKGPRTNVYFMGRSCLSRSGQLAARSAIDSLPLL